ncbi:hypothetical protein GCM10010302_68120 [Streptomyces polychromogenes]|uniref:Uncharacterized protein n=1 Tax=Streptomyces polychromogenes TaxID=67342 RepID=A0ABP3FJ82_9ACTN
MEPSNADCDTRSDRVVVICSLLREGADAGAFALPCVMRRQLPGCAGPRGPRPADAGGPGREGAPLSLIVIRPGTDRDISGSSG